MDEGCICKGNWRDIIKETKDQLGTWYKDTEGTQWLLQGIVWAEDDFYYSFINHHGRSRYMSCVGHLQTYQMTPLLKCVLCSRWWDPEEIIEHLGECEGLIEL